METRGSPPSRLERITAAATGAVATGWRLVTGRTDGSGHRLEDTEGSAAPTILTDGGSRELPTGEDPEETPFIWGPTREPPDDGGSNPDGSPAETLEAIEDRLDELADTADHLSILATNATLKLARDEPGDLAGIAYDVEADARALHRALADLESRVERLRGHLGDPPDDRADDDAPNRPERTGSEAERTRTQAERTRSQISGRTGSDGAGRDRVSSERPGVQLPGGDLRPTGPWRVAGVDLTTWPGHLAQVDFEHLRARVARSETVASGRVPRDVAEFSLDDRELPFDALLALDPESDLGPADPEGGESADDGV